ncbi:hypothetical protein ACFLY8_02730 [Halobacteriota archaeon]
METTEAMEMGKRRFLKYLAIAGAIATMGISGCVSEPEPTPAPSMPTRTAPALPTKAPTQTPTPISTPTPTPTLNIAQKISSNYDDYYMTLAKTTLIGAGLNVTNAYVVRGEYITNAGLYIINGRGAGKSEERALMLLYVSNVGTKEELALETGSITHTFTDLVRDGWDIDAIIVAVGDIKNNIIGTWHCEGFWIRDYLEGKTSRETLYSQIMNTHKFREGCHMSLSSLGDADCHSF